MALHCSKVLKLLKEEKVVSETVSGTATKSDVWKHFTFLNFSKDHTTAAGQYTGFVLCSFCKSALKHNRTTSGTTHLRDHVTHCLKNPSRPNKLNHPSTSKPITAFFEAPVARLSQSDKKKLLNASVEYIAQDISPFKAIEDPGFLKLADCLVRLGAQYGNFDVKKALPSRHTAKRHAFQQAEEKQQEVISHFLSAIKANGYVGITTDMWTDSNSRSYLLYH